ncbi:iron ABC transporter, partial [Bradyrhizobium sp. Arg68]|nr:iron ABC transporter [Bradyrhizobium ivorense]
MSVVAERGAGHRRAGLSLRPAATLTLLYLLAALAGTALI